MCNAHIQSFKELVALLTDNYVNATIIIILGSCEHIAQGYVHQEA
jgi:hypothetical protein